MTFAQAPWVGATPSGSAPSQLTRRASAGLHKARGSSEKASYRGAVHPPMLRVFTVVADTVEYGTGLRVVR